MKRNLPSWGSGKCSPAGDEGPLAAGWDVLGLLGCPPWASLPGADPQVRPRCKWHCMDRPGSCLFLPSAAFLPTSSLIMFGSQDILSRFFAYLKMSVSVSSSHGGWAVTCCSGWFLSAHLSFLFLVHFLQDFSLFVVLCIPSLFKWREKVCLSFMNRHTQCKKQISVWPYSLSYSAVYN